MIHEFTIVAEERQRTAKLRKTARFGQVTQTLHTRGICPDTDTVSGTTKISNLIEAEATLNDTESKTSGAQRLKDALHIASVLLL